MSRANVPAQAKALCDFINRSPSPFHAVANAASLLRAAGFTPLDEASPWALVPGRSYYFTRNASTLIAFSVGARANGASGFSVVGAHTDSPDLRIKPVSASAQNGYAKLGVMTYGGGLWHTWFDRDLTIAGRVLVRTSGDDDGKGDDDGGKGGDGKGMSRIEGRLIHATEEGPIARIPSLAIHLDRTQNDKFAVGKEDHVVPVLAAGLEADLGLAGLCQKEGPAATEDGGAAPCETKHHRGLIELVARLAKCEPSEIEDLELSVVDHAKCAIGGLRGDFVFAPRLDNLCMSYCGVEALIASQATVAEASDIRVLALFDHEEVGSASTQGAASSLMLDTMRRVSNILQAAQPDSAGADAFDLALRKSFLISADMAHAVHPTLPGKHEANHRPRIHGGPVIKTNANQRYATNGPTSTVIREIGRRHGIPIQEFVVRNDSPCGSTIGPILASNAGLRTVDIGNAMLSMHSIREMCGTHDIKHAIDLMIGFYNEFEDIDRSIDAEASARN